MFTVNGDSDARIGYELLKNIEERFNKPDGNTESRKARIDYLKREIRKWTNRKDEKQRIIVKDYGIDGFIYRERMPFDFESKEEAEEWFRDNEYRTCRPSMYDCTGQWFTEWFKVFKRNGEWWFYHCIGVDV